MSDNIKLYQGECIELMKKMPSNSIDSIIADIPYGITTCKWDSVIPFNVMWEQLNRIIKDKGAIVLFGSQPFTSVLVNSNIKNFKYEWIYQKRVGSNFASLKYHPMKEHENVLIFSKGTHNYYPVKQLRKGKGLGRNVSPYLSETKRSKSCASGMKSDKVGRVYDPKFRNPSSVQEFNNKAKGQVGFHPTQKPVELMEYLVKTYTKENETVLDFTMGSGSTGVACKNLNRKFIGIELDEKYFRVAEERIL